MKCKSAYLVVLALAVEGDVDGERGGVVMGSEGGLFSGRQTSLEASISSSSLSLCVCVLVRESV